jgi:ADP-heptose:LPS heptosyltransferase
LGDAVILTPALKALATQIPNIELHLLVAAEIAPLLENLPWITKVWAMPRQRGKAKLWDALPFIQALRQEKFDQSIDFGGNDRGALLSYLSGVRIRLGPIDSVKPKWMHRICYTQIIKRKNPGAPYFDLHFELLHAWNIRRPDLLKMEIACDAVDVELVSKLLPDNSIICHITTSQPKKDWPVSHWQALYHLARQTGLKLVFSAGPNDRERKLLSELKALVPEADMLPPIGSLKLFLSILKSSKMLLCGDTGPLHFAEGLGVPVLGIFGEGNSIKQVAPIYNKDQLICAGSCECEERSNNLNFCQATVSCMASIQPEAVFLKLKNRLQIGDST